MTLVRLVSIATALLLTLIASTPAHTATPSLDDLAWIAGHWRGQMDGGTTEEVWSAPAGDSMMGMFRYVKDGKTVFYELLAIEQEERGPVLKLKHFGRGLVGWEEKDVAILLPLVRHGATEAVFESDDKERMTRLTFRRPSPDAMTVTLDKLRDGKATSQEFAYSRVR